MTETEYYTAHTHDMLITKTSNEQANPSSCHFTVPRVRLFVRNGTIRPDPRLSFLHHQLIPK